MLTSHRGPLSTQQANVTAFRHALSHPGALVQAMRYRSTPRGGVLEPVLCRCNLAPLVP